MGVDGLYFLDCFKDDGEAKSAIAFYKNFQRGANDNQFPDDITDAPSSPANTLRFWETGSTQCMSSPPSSSFSLCSILISNVSSTAVTFGNGTVFRFNIAGDAASKATGQVAGTADNGFERFTIFKDDQRQLIITNDGFKCKTIYFAQSV
jgi:hypothetical protein